MICESIMSFRNEHQDMEWMMLIVLNKHLQQIKDLPIDLKRESIQLLMMEINETNSNKFTAAPSLIGEPETICPRNNLWGYYYNNCIKQ